MQGVLDKFKAEEISLDCFKLTSTEEQFRACSSRFLDLYKKQTKGLFVRAMRSQKKEKR